MRISAFTALAGALLLAACATNPSVDTVAAPNFSTAGRTTFRILPVPTPPSGMELGDNDPMLTNSITNRALRDDITRSLMARGYRPAAPGAKADFDVAAYAAANRELDIHTYDYGYTWTGWPRQYTEVDTYEKGTVIIDLVDPSTHQLLWRGKGVSAVSDDPDKFIDDMGRVVDAVLKKLPPAGSR